MAMQRTKSSSPGGEEGVVKTLIRGLVRTGGIYADARLAADQESDPSKREMREYAAEKARSALLEDIAAANGYIEILKGKVEESKNGSNAKEEPEAQAVTEETDLQDEIGEDNEKPTGEEAEEVVDPAADATAPEPEDECNRVLEEEDAAETEETETEDAVTPEEAVPVDETESVEEMFGLERGTADAISEVLFSGPRNAIEPNERLDKRNLEKIALVLDALDVDEAEIKDRTEAFLRHKGFDDEAIIEETVEAVTNLWREYQQDDES